MNRHKNSSNSRVIIDINFLVINCFERKYILVVVHYSENMSYFIINLITPTISNFFLRSLHLLELACLHICPLCSRYWFQESPICFVCVMLEIDLRPLNMISMHATTDLYYLPRDVLLFILVLFSLVGIKTRDVSM